MPTCVRCGQRQLTALLFDPSPHAMPGSQRKISGFFLPAPKRACLGSRDCQGIIMHRFLYIITSSVCVNASVQQFSLLLRFSLSLPDISSERPGLQCHRAEQGTGHDGNNWYFIDTFLHFKSGILRQLRTVRILQKLVHPVPTTRTPLLHNHYLTTAPVLRTCHHCRLIAQRVSSFSISKLRSCLSVMPIILFC